MTIQHAAQIVLGTNATCAAEFEAARKVMFDAARRGYKFATRGPAANPVVIVTDPE